MKKLHRFIGDFVRNKTCFFIILFSEYMNLKPFFEDYFKQNDMDKAFRKLISGLDKDSVDLVFLIIKRIKTVIKKPKIFPAVFLKTKEEKRQMSVIEKEMASIKKTDKGFYTYKGFILRDKNYFDVIRDDFLAENVLEGQAVSKIKNNNIIDAGAFIGDSALVFSQYTDKKIYAFEPSANNYHLLLKTIELNSMSGKIIPINKGISGGSEKLFISDNTSSSCLSKEYIEGAMQIETTALDSFVKENNLDIGLIKTDVEGFEMNLLNGAQETIKAQRPVMLISIYHNARDFFEIKPLIESWNLNYKFKIRKMSFALFLETVLICLPQ
ncbi:MAG: FkbM family methyltransferase [Elusimicrobiota bacterium]|jgi:FkbM family methyltransferase|nr:FkbM family methyltransferase [Elusimicrobiota bacterium]